jgi:hypothetical protein
MALVMMIRLFGFVIQDPFLTIFGTMEKDFGFGPHRDMDNTVTFQTVVIIIGKD